MYKFIYTSLLFFSITSLNAQRTFEKALNSFLRNTTTGALNDSLIIIKFLHLVNKEKGDFYYEKAEVIYSEDSTFKVVNLFGESVRGVTYNRQGINYIIKGKSLLNTSFGGQVFRIDKLATGKYLFYVNDYWRLGSHFRFFEISFSKNVVNVVPAASHPNFIFSYITNKIEKPENFPNNFDFSKPTSNDVLQVFYLDSTKVGSDEYYFLSEDSFLKTDIYGYTFTLYYKHSYGDQMEKILRIQNESSIREITLAMQGGDSDAYRSYTEFVNDSIFVESFIYTQTAKDNPHVMAYDTDSVVKKFKYNELFELKEISKDSFHFYKEYPVYHKNLKDSVFKVSGAGFEINGMLCKWIYHVMYDYGINENSKEINVAVVKKDLVNVRTNKIILTGLEDYSRPVNIVELDNNLPDTTEMKDINFDGFPDFKTYCFSCSGSGGEYYNTYVYRPAKGIFEHSEIFSGASVRFDTINRRVSSYGKSGVDDYCEHFYNLKRRSEVVASEETTCYERGMYKYVKRINGKIVSTGSGTINEAGKGVKKRLQRKK